MYLHVYVSDSLDSDDALCRGVPRPVNLYLRRRDVANCIDVAAATSNDTTDRVCRHQQSLRPTQYKTNTIIQANNVKKRKVLPSHVGL